MAGKLKVALWRTGWWGKDLSPLETSWLRSPLSPAKLSGKHYEESVAHRWSFSKKPEKVKTCHKDASRVERWPARFDFIFSP